MFPTAHSTVYYNEAGEPLGWSDESYYEPDPYEYENDSAEDVFAEELYERAEDGDIDFVLRQHEVAEGKALRIVHDVMRDFDIEDPDGPSCADR